MGAQTAQAVANEINAAVMVAGAAACGLVTVDATSGQLVLIGSIPGCKQRLEITTVNATIGFVGTPAKALGSGDPLVINGNFISELVAVAGSKLWIKGSASLNILLAGT